MPADNVVIRNPNNLRNAGKTKRKKLVSQIFLGAVVFVAIVGVVLGLSILFGALKSPTDQESETNKGQGETAESESIPEDIFPYKDPAGTFLAEYLGGRIVVHIYLDMDKGDFAGQEETVKSKMGVWLETNGLDAEALEASGDLEWKTK